MLKAKATNNLKLKMMIDRTIKALENSYVSFLHNYRKGNQVADSLAKPAANITKTRFSTQLMSSLMCLRKWANKMMILCLCNLHAEDPRKIYFSNGCSLSCLDFGAGVRIRVRVRIQVSDSAKSKF